MIFNGRIEICEMSEDEVAARTKIKMTALRIHDATEDHNDNGINWTENFVNENIKSFIGAPYKVAFVDDDKTVPSGHGNMEHNERGEVIFPDSDTVGTILDAYIEDTEIDGKIEKLLVTEGYLFYQSYPDFVDWLKEEANSNTVFGSVEINGKGKDKNIIYANESKDENGDPAIGRQPQIFDFTALAILSSLVEPSDKSSQIIELNSKNKEGAKILKKVKSTSKIELNELSYEDVSCIISRAFNKAMMNPETYCNCCYDYCIYKLYPVSGRVVFSNWCDIPAHYYMTTYSIQGNEVIIGDISEVEMDFKPIDNEQAVEINTALIKDILLKSNKKEDVDSMDEKQIAELNQKFEDKVKELGVADAKVVELGEVIVNSNKTYEELNAKFTSLTEELNACKTELDAMKAEKSEAEENAIKEQKIAEVNTYFDTEISKNGFADEEINSLKVFVESVDLDGLKKAESELCTKKIKEMATKQDFETELNSKTSINFIALHEKEKKVITDKVISFFD